MTALKVYNWFANRRKEMKRRANIGECPFSSIEIQRRVVSVIYIILLPIPLTQPEAAILESHGIEVPSPSCHSNGEEGEMQEFTDQVNHHRFTEQVSHAS